MLTLRDTTILKGVAILFMIFGHLFGPMHNVKLCTNYLFIHDIPLVHLLTRCTNPVPFYVILSGYGLYISYSKGKRNGWMRLKKLYIHYWISLLIFVTLGYFVIGGEKYPGSLQDVVCNVTGWDPTYNGEIWFLFPYMLVMLSSPFLFKYMIDRMNPLRQVGMVFFLSLCTGYVISHYGDAYLYTHRLPYMPILYLSFLFPFSIGAQMAKYHLLDRIRIGGQKCILLLLLLLICFRALFQTGAFHAIYVAAFILLFAKCKRPAWLDDFLFAMGRRSTSMWFVHSYFCYYLFHDFIYGMKYPAVIFVALVVISWSCAVVIDALNKHIQTVLHLNDAKKEG